MLLRLTWLGLGFLCFAAQGFVTDWGSTAYYAYFIVGVMCMLGVCILCQIKPVNTNLHLTFDVDHEMRKIEVDGVTWVREVNK